MKYQLTKEYIIALMLSLGGDGTTPQSTGEHRSAGLQSKLCQKKLHQTNHRFCQSYQLILYAVTEYHKHIQIQLPSVYFEKKLGLLHRN